MASRRTTVVLTADDEGALEAASHAEGRSQSELIRKGIRLVTAPYRRRRPSVGWLCLSPRERNEILSEEFRDRDR
jgi:hypothetical protein